MEVGIFKVSIGDEFKCDYEVKDGKLIPRVSEPNEFRLGLRHTLTRVELPDESRIIGVTYERGGIDEESITTLWYTAPIVYQKKK